MTEEEIKTTERLHTIVLKEKDKEGNWLSLDVDTIFPVAPFGETVPMIMAIVDDKSYFIPLAQINWYEQNHGVKGDLELAQTMNEQRMKKKGNRMDVSVS